MNHNPTNPVLSGAPLSRRAGFTLIEMLVVIAVIGIVAAITVPALKNLKKSDAAAAGTRQLLDDLARARQLAISRRTTVYMVFAAPEFWTDANYGPLAGGFTANDRIAVTNILDKQLVGYNFVTLRDVGDQPGVNRPRYLDEWRALPDGIYIDPQTKFVPRNTVTAIKDPNTGSFVRNVRGFDVLNTIPFPSGDTLGTGPTGDTYINLPFIAFNFQGQLISDKTEEVIPLVRGRVSPVRAAQTKAPQFSMPDVSEDPPGNSTNAYNLIVVDRLTGRTSVDHM